MATGTTAKSPSPAKETTNAKSAQSIPSPSQNDAKLLTFVRANGPQIVSALTYRSSREGEERNWTAMQEYLQIANQFSHLCGLGQMAGGAQQRAMAAGTSGV
jgi:hypothetical protein